MAAYNRRDLFAHWIRKDQAANRPCQHACCRGMRAHPDGYPVVKRRAYYQSVSDRELMAEYERHSGESKTDERIRAQVMAEAQRRDVAQERREAALSRRAAGRQEREGAREQAFIRAETETRGYLLNRRGLEAGVDPKSLFAGSEERARRYASEELLAHWETVPRPSAAALGGPGRRPVTNRAGGSTGVRRRMTAEERYYRDQYERVQYNVERGLMA